MGKKNNSKTKEKSEAKKPFLSGRQRRVFLIVILAMFILVPIVDNFRCKAACLKRVKTPYPEIACKYQCPWPWARNDK
jgi:hypothetical protein